MGFFKSLLRGNSGGNDYRDGRSSGRRQRAVSLPPNVSYDYSGYYPSPPAYQPSRNTVPPKRHRTMRPTEDPSSMTAFYSGASPTQPSFNGRVRFAANNGYTYQR